MCSRLTFFRQLLEQQRFLPPDAPACTLYLLVDADVMPLQPLAQLASSMGDTEIRFQKEPYGFSDFVNTGFMLARNTHRVRTLLGNVYKLSLPSFIYN